MDRNFVGRLALAAMALVFTAACSGVRSGSFASESSTELPTGATYYSALLETCEIKSSTGILMYSTIQTNITSCDSRCQALGQTDPNRTCMFGAINLAIQSDCYIIGSPGMQLTAPTMVTHQECAQSCASFASSADRSCRWDGIEIANVDVCNIQAADGLGLVPLALQTRGQCHAQCDTFSSSDPGRTCSWGSANLR
jgi:hypothetical protein